MPKKTDLKIVLAVMAGVLAAGYVMSQFSNIGPIAAARDGFN
jgi:hypothetical protein